MNLRTFFSSPVFADDEQTRIGRLLHRILWMSMLAVIIAGVMMIIALPENLFRWLSLLFTVNVTHLILMSANHRGATRGSSIILLLEFWLLTTIFALTAGGNRAPAMTGYLLIVLLAGLLINTRTGIAAGFVCALSGLGFALLEINGYLPATLVTHNAWSLWILQVFFIALIVSIQLLATQSITSALHKAQEQLTEREQADRALRENEERYRSLVLATAQVVWNTNAAGEVIEDVPSWREFTGRTIEESIGRGWLNAVHPDDRDSTAQIWAKAVATRSIYQTEYRLRRADGEWRDMTVRGVPVIEKDGTIREWVGFCHDITQRKRVEREVRKLHETLEHVASVTANTIGEEYFETLVGHLAESLAVRYAFVGQLIENHERVRTLAVWAEDRLVENFAYSLAGTPCANVITQKICIYPDKVQTLFPADLLLAQMGVQSYCGTPVLGRNGQPLGLLVVMDDKPMALPGERVRALLAIFAARAGMELERMQTDSALRKSEEKFAKAFQCSPVILTLSTAKDMRYIAVNETFTKAIGYQSKEVIGKTPRDLGLLADPRDLDTFMELLKVSGEIRNYEFPVRTKDGETRAGLVSAELIEVSGEPCVLAMTEDITERKKAEIILRRSHEELEHMVKERTKQLQAANKELEAFSCTVSHDLQSPLRAILGFAMAMDEDYGGILEPEGREFLRRIVQSSGRMSQLIDDLLTYSRIGRNAIDLRPVPLNELVREIASDFDLRLREIGGEMQVGDLPVVQGDRTLLIQTFSNLFQNAINYRRKDVPLKLAVATGEGNGSAVIRVVDNGVGIASEFQEKIFQAFQRLHSEKECPGTGLGLANVKKSVESMGGEVWVESKPGQGSAFCLRLKAVG